MKTKVIPERVYERDGRHAIMANDVWYSFYGSEPWGDGEDGQPRKGKLITGEEYEIEYDVTKSKKDGKEYNTIKTVRRLTFKESNGEGSGELVAREEPGKALTGKEEPAKQEVATVENQISALVPSAGTLKVSKEDQKILLKDIPDEDVEIRPDGLIYAPWEVYATRLNSIFGLAWSSIPSSFKPSREGDHIYWGFSLVIQGKFAGYSIGQQKYHPSNMMMTWGDACEGAKSNALMRLCKGLGIGLNLWRPSYIRYWIEKYAEQYYDKKKKKTLWRRKGQVDKPDVIEAEVVEEPKKEEVRLTTTTPCSKDQQKEIRDLIAEVADTWGAKKKEVSATVMKKFKFDGFDQVSVEKAEEIKQYLIKEREG